MQAWLLSAALIMLVSCSVVDSRHVAGDAPPLVKGTVKADELPHGHLLVEGSPIRYEYFRGTFGGALPCGVFPMALAPPDNSTDGRPLGCRPWSDEEAASVRDHLVVIWRGKCPFAEKAAHAQAAGAAGVVVVNNEIGLLRMPMGNVTAGANVTIPVVMIRNSTSPLLELNLRNLTTMGYTTTPLRASFLPSLGDCLEAVGASADINGNGDTLAETSSPYLQTSLDWTTSMVFARVRTSADSSDGTGFDTEVEFTAASFGGVFLPGVPLRVSLAAPRNACEPFDALAAAAVAGTVLVVQRGECALVNKSRVAQAAGAVGVIIVNSPADPPSSAQETAIRAAAAAQGRDVSNVSFSELLLFGPNAGSVQAFSDGGEHEVHIPVAMASHSGLHWLWDAFDKRPVGSHVTVEWRPMHIAAMQQAWETLRTIRDAGSAFWPTDVEARRRVLLDLIGNHHPNSETVRSGMTLVTTVLYCVIGCSTELCHVVFVCVMLNHYRAAKSDGTMRSSCARSLAATGRSFCRPKRRLTGQTER
jgi:hypothetical protein